MLHKPFMLAALLAVASGVPAAESDLTAIRQQIDEMKKNYEQRIAALESRLAQAEAKAERPLEAVAAPSQTPTEMQRPAASTAAASVFNPEVSLILQGQYKNMKNVPNRRISGFAAADTAVSNGRGFSADETELVVAANIDPYWRGQAIVAMLDGQAEIEEAWVQSLGIGHGLGLKMGRYRSGIGYLNEQHPHQRDFADAPLIYQAMFGDSYTQDGVQLKWLAPTPVFLEFGAEVGRGASFPGTDRNKNGSGGGALYAHVGDDFGIAHSWRAGLSWLRTAASEREASFDDINYLPTVGRFSGDSTTWLADFVWKWAPNGNPKDQNFKFQSEYFIREEKGSLNCSSDDPANACATALTSDYRTRQRGWYAQGVYQFAPAWRAGLRYEMLDSGQRDVGANASNLLLESYRPKKATAMVDYSWSEFSRVRLQYAQDQSMAGISDQQLTMQYIMSLGAHGAHKF